MGTIVENMEQRDKELIEQLEGTEAELYDFIVSQRRWPTSTLDPRHENPWREVAFRVGHRKTELGLAVVGGTLRDPGQTDYEDVSGMTGERSRHLEGQHIALCAVERELRKDQERIERQKRASG